MVEKRKISFRSIKNICVDGYDGSSINHYSTYKKYCMRIYNEELESRCNAKNCPIWKRLEKC